MPLNILGIINIIEANKMHYFSTLFWYKTLHDSDRLIVPHQESRYCIHSIWYLSYYLCCLSASEVEMEHVEFYIKIKLRNSASCWLLLYENITMDGPQNTKSLESVNKSIHRKYYIMLIMQEGNAVFSAVESIAVIQRNSVFRTILQVPPTWDW
jgi:hypothetical protein